jgi:phenylpropionate dioxygenase-like ring-hydroxylating dioxygenase large terminal subunit
MDTSHGIFRHFHPVYPSASIAEKPVRVELDNRRIVLFRSESGIAALDDNCPHRRTPLSFGVVKDGRLHCAYHGWNYGADGVGSAPLQPRLKCSVGSYTVVEHLGYVWLAARGTPLSHLPSFIEPAESLSGLWENCLPMRPISLLFKAPLPQTIDNFAEIEHVPFIHKVLGWSIECVPQMTVNVVAGEDYTEAKGWGPQRQPPSRLLRLLDKHLFRLGDVSLLEWDMKFNPCHTTFMPGWGDPNSGKRRAFSVRATSVFVPETSNTTRLINFPFVRLHEPRLKRLAPLVKFIARKNLLMELTLDKQACEMVGEESNELTGMRLGIRDKQLIQNRKLLNRIYYGIERTVVPLELETESSRQQLAGINAPRAPL